MDLKQIEYFVRVAELGSFTRASIVLDIAQPALSRPIRQLEVELRQTLLLRNGRGVTLTEAGKHRRAGVWLLTPQALEAELAHLGPDALGLTPSARTVSMLRKRSTGRFFAR